MHRITRVDSERPDESAEEQQAELIKLQRQFRLLEDDRRAYREEAEHILKKQKDTISNLTNEHEELEKDNKLAGSQRNQTSDAGNTAKLHSLLDEEELTAKDTTEENGRVSYVEKKISNMRKKVDSLRKEMGGVKESERRCKMMQKLNRVMENRLNKGNVKFNSALAENMRMREEIGHIKIQRNRFDDLFKKLTNAHQRGKINKDKLMERSTEAFSKRDEAVHKMQFLRERNERDMTTYNAELKDLLRIIDHDRELREFMATKTEERGEMYEAAVQGRRDKKLLDYIKTLQNEVEHYETIFTELKEVSGIDDVKEMVETFIAVEDENFAAFNYVKDQNLRIQKYEAQIQQFKDDTEALNRDGIFLEKEQKIILKELEGKNADILALTDNINKIWKKDKKLLDKLSPLISELFDRVKCDRALMAELLGGSSVSDENIISYLGLIEQKASEMTQAKVFINARGTDQVAPPTEPEVPFFSFATVGRLAKLVVQPPSISTDMPEAPTNNTLLPGQQLPDSVRPFTKEEARAAAFTAAKHLAKAKN